MAFLSDPNEISNMKSCTLGQEYSKHELKLHISSAHCNNLINNTNSVINLELSILQSVANGLLQVILSEKSRCVTMPMHIYQHRGDVL